MERQATKELMVRCYRLGNELMNEYGLTEKGWKFQLGNSKVRIGVCKHDRKVIEYSIHYLMGGTPWDEVVDTILHEIAHALVGRGHGHDATWRAMCIKVGAKPIRCGDDSNVSAATHNFEIVCSGCGRTWKRFRLRRSLIGKDSACCHAPLKFYQLER